MVHLCNRRHLRPDMTFEGQEKVKQNIQFCHFVQKKQYVMPKNYYLCAKKLKPYSI